MSSGKMCSRYMDLILDRCLSRRGRSQMRYENIWDIVIFLLASLSWSLAIISFTISSDSHLSFPHTVVHLPEHLEDAEFTGVSRFSCECPSQLVFTKEAWIGILPFGFLGTSLVVLTILFSSPGNRVHNDFQSCPSCLHKNCLRQRFFKTQKKQ